MNKQDFIWILQKYHLSGKCKDVKWEIRDKNLIVDFLTDDGAMLGTLSGVVDLEDAEVAVFNTDRLITLLGALGDDIQGQYKKVKDRIPGINFSDDVTNVYFTTGEMTKVPDIGSKIQAFRDRGRKLSPEPVIAYEISLNKESIARFLKAKKALSDAKIVGIEPSINSVNLIVNYTEHNENRITIPFNASIISDTPLFIYNVELLALVLSVNDGFRGGKMSVSDQGLIIMEFCAEDYEVVYYLKALKQ